MSNALIIILDLINIIRVVLNFGKCFENQFSSFFYIPHNNIVCRTIVIISHALARTAAVSTASPVVFVKATGVVRDTDRRGRTLVCVRVRVRVCARVRAADPNKSFREILIVAQRKPRRRRLPLLLLRFACGPARVFIRTILYGRSRSCRVYATLLYARLQGVPSVEHGLVDAIVIATVFYRFWISWSETKNDRLGRSTGKPNSFADDRRFWRDHVKFVSTQQLTTIIYRVEEHREPVTRSRLGYVLQTFCHRHIKLSIRGRTIRMSGKYRMLYEWFCQIFLFLNPFP